MKSKKKYTKKQITEAIKYWEKQLQRINESTLDKETLERRLQAAASDSIQAEMPDDVEQICREMASNYVYNLSQQMLMKFARGRKDKSWLEPRIKDIADEDERVQKIYELYLSQYEHPDATELYAACNGDIDNNLYGNIEVLGAEVKDNTYDFKSVEIKFRYKGKTYIGTDVWNSGNVSNDDQEEFEHCSEDDFQTVIDWARSYSDKSIMQLPASFLSCISGKYIKAAALLDILEMTLFGGDSDDAKYVKIV